tara:strand:+ start:79 stop:741 length:663 start_codon:yes stop_codon:yes gene_type:complete
MTLFKFDFDTQTFYEITTRNGASFRKKWSEINEQIFLKDITFGVCNHPFNPGEISFRRKTFTPYTDKDYGICIKGTQLSEEEYKSVMDTTTQKVNPLINKLFWKWGEKHWQSYPNLVKNYKSKGLWDLVRQNPEQRGTYKHETFRKFPSWDTTDELTGDMQRIYYQPYPIKALRFGRTSGTMNIIFNEGATIKTWHDLHDTIHCNWREIVNRKATAAQRS